MNNNYGNIGYDSGKDFKVAHLDVRRMTGGYKFDMPKHQITTSNIDIFTLSQTWLNLSRCPYRNVFILSYLQETKGQHLKGGGGLTCFIKNGIKFSDTKFANLNRSCPD